MAWNPLNKATLDRTLSIAKPGSIFVGRQSSGKCCVGYVESSNELSVTIVNGSYEVTLWFKEPRQFTMLDPPKPQDVRVGERELKL